MAIAEKGASSRPVVIIGAGPAGLTAAYDLASRGTPTMTLEADRQVGGLARTVEYKGFRFDIGGHRFFTKVGIVQDLWRTMLGAELLTRPRLSRIYYRGRFFDYPLKPLNALRNLGVLTSLAVLASYVWARLFPIRPERSFEDWVTNRFGERLYRIFFETYTEKVWGIPCRAISAQWAAQRIKGLSLLTTIVNMLFPWLNRRPGATIKTLIDQFEYPRLGPGMMWDAFRDRVLGMGGRIELEAPVTRIVHDGGRVQSVEFERAGRRTRVEASHVISTMPLRHLVHALEPAPPDAVLAAADRLKYRDFLTVALVIKQPHLFPDNWIYIHDSRVSVGRIQNFKNWSPDMVPDSACTCLGLEYFCSEGDRLWSMSDERLIELGREELDRIGLARPEDVVDGTVVRMPKAYPVYDDGYTDALAILRRHLETFENLQVIGRNGSHKYNNQDHSMLMAILAVRNLYGERHVLWAVNADDEYQEEGAATEDVAADVRRLAATQPMVPTRVAAD